MNVCEEHKNEALGALKLARDENVPAKRADFFTLKDHKYQIRKTIIYLFKLSGIKVFKFFPGNSNLK